MLPWQAFLLGLVEGITEFLPVSSTGHLILAQHALRIEDTNAVQAFEICIQAGAIAAVLAVFLPRVRSMLAGLVGRDAQGLRLALQLAVAFAPAAIAGLAFGAEIKRELFGVRPVIGALFVGGVVILLVPRLRARRSDGGIALAQLDFARAFAIGVFQCLALWPGTSRSLATIAGALLLGLSASAAVEFSLLLGFVTLLAATAHEAHAHGAAMLREIGPASLAIGFLTAAVSAFLAVRWLVRYLERRGLAVFGVYRIALALVIALVL